MNISILIENCQKMGREATKEYTQEELGKMFAKEICRNKILDDDAFEIAAEAFQKGKNETKKN